MQKNNILKFLNKKHNNENAHSQQIKQNDFLKSYINNKGEQIALPTINPGPTINDILTEIKKKTMRLLTKYC